MSNSNEIASNLLECMLFSQHGSKSKRNSHVMHTICKYACKFIFRGEDINTYRVHVNDNASNGGHSGVSYHVFYIYTL